MFLKLKIRILSMKKIEIEAQVTSNDYFGLMYTVFYNIPFIKIINSLALLLLLPSVFYYFDVFIASPSFISLGIALFILLLPPAFLYFKFKKKLKEAEEVGKKITYIFSQRGVKIITKTVKITYYWRGIDEVIEIKNWIFISSNPEDTLLIKKEAFSKEKLRQFKKLINSLPNLKKSLKE